MASRVAGWVVVVHHKQVILAISSGQKKNGKLVQYKIITEL